ncbi:hypothetical protein WJX72_003451 [[Myrmecia] bisecta]|uniref:Transcriptional regulatory protein n=1 Tax=[Myrmecia] bisecta TaxID=41462 RepID=A0AAW1PVX4_9CHLO
MGRRSSKIATRKGAQDAQKAKRYGKIGKLIIQAVKAGGSDPQANTKLKEVLNQAKLVECPKDIIERNLKKATDKSQEDFKEVTYEAYGPGGTGFVMECLTDNVNRSATDVRNAVTRTGGKMADPGSVLFNFQRQGLVFVAPSAGEDEVFEAAMDAGADDVQPVKGEEGCEGYKLLTSVEDFVDVLKNVSSTGIPVDNEHSGLVYSPLTTVEVEDDILDQNALLFERLLSVDDIDAVHTTCAGLQR